MRLLLAALALALAPVALAGSLPEPTALPRPAFPPPATDVNRSGPRLVLMSSRYRDPGQLPPDARPLPAWAPRSYRGAELESAVGQGRRVFLLYGGRYLLRGDTRTRTIRYAYDFRTFALPPGGGSAEPVTWAREVDGVLYVSNSHLTYASVTNGRNAYLSAVDLRKRHTRWRSRALVANARTFVVAGDLIVSGYGFTAEPDFLYLLDRRSGRLLDRLPVPSAPERIRLRGDRLLVRTYDRDVVARIAR